MIVTSRDQARADAAAVAVGVRARGLAVDLARPETIEPALRSVEQVDHLVITAIEQGLSTLRGFDIPLAIRVVTIKLVGYAETVRVLMDRFGPDASVVLFGGLAKERPIGVDDRDGLQWRHHRVGEDVGGRDRSSSGQRGASGRGWGQSSVAVGGDHPQVARTPIGRLVTMAEVAEATRFLLHNSGVNAHDLFVDGGVLTS